jgi:branched-chain amino acid transport system ATP-binding protein
MPLLEVRDLTVRFGGVVALDRVTFDVNAGEVVALLGENGAGKSTMSSIVALYRLPGTMALDGEPVLRQPRRSSAAARPHVQNLALFRSMSVLENVLSETTSISGAVSSRRRSAAGASKAEAGARKRAMDVLDFVAWPPARSSR